MTELGRHIEESLNVAAKVAVKVTLKATLLWAFKSIPQVCVCCWCPGSGCPGR
jgi:hypothetical protein